MPTVEEWNILINYLGEPAVAGAKLKGGGSAEWCNSDEASDELGFNALTTVLVTGGSFDWWLTTWWIDNAASAVSFIMSCKDPSIRRGAANKNTGRVIRCIKNR